MRLKLGLFLTIGLLSSKCEKHPIEQTEQFDKTSLLNNYAENLIKPGYQRLSESISELKTTYNTFQQNTNIGALQDLQDAWLAAYKDFQNVQMFDFGPAMDVRLKAALGTYPTDTNKINNNVVNGSWNLGSADNTDAVGFPALDYLLHDLSNQNVIDKVSVGNNRDAYILAVIEKIESEVLYVSSAWESYYAATFKANTGTSSTSSMSYLVNEFNKDFELSKNAKVGIPAGVQSLGIQRPAYIEAPFSKKSLEILQTSMLSLLSMYKGSNGLGFDDYLTSFEGSGTELNTIILAQFNNALDEIETVKNVEFKELIENNPSKATKIYEELQANVVNIKTDMPALFGIFITYQDNDGD